MKDRRMKLILGAICAILMCCLGYVAFMHYSFHRSSFKKINLIIKSLPIGINKFAALAYLDAHKVEHSKFLIDGNMIIAIVREDKVSVFINKSTQIRLMFDDSGKLTKIFTKDIFTGP